VGTGISGLALAAMLGGARADVTVLGQTMTPARKPAFAGIVSASDQRVLGLDLTSDDALPLDRIAHVALGMARPSPHRVPEGWVAIEHGRLLDALKATVRARGVTVIPDATVTGFAWTDGVVSGVRNEETGAAYPADLIVLADESSPRLAEALGLRPDWSPSELMHLGKRRYAADPATVHNRFGGDGGVTVHSFERAASWGSPGWSVVIPTTDAITVAVAMSLEEAMVSTRHISEYLDEIERASPVRELLANLPVASYMTEVVPVGGFDARNAFHADQVLVVNDLVGVTHPLNRDGFSANLAVCAVAARTIDAAVSSGDFSRKTLGRYSAAIADDLVLPVNAARRIDKMLRFQPPWLWAAKADLFAAGPGVTAGPKPATLEGHGDRGAWRRIRGWGRVADVRRHAPGEHDE